MAAKSNEDTPARVARPKAAGKSAQRPKKTAGAAALVQDPVDAGQGTAGLVHTLGGRDTAVLKTKDLIDRVTEVSGGKKKDVKSIVEAALAQIGAALGRGESLNLQGFGHLRVARKATADSPVATLKLRQGEAGKAKPKSDAGEEKDTLAEDSDQG